MKNNKVLLSFDMNGNFLSLQEDSNKIYAGSVASIEYYVDFSENLSANDLVYISFTKPDHEKLAPLICERVLDNRFRLLSTGAELDYKLTDIAELTIDVIVKSKNVITNAYAIKAQASIVVNVYPGSQYVPGIVEDSLLSNLEEHLNYIEKYTIKKYSVADIENDTILIPYATDGIKEAPAIYTGYANQVKYYDWAVESYKTISVQGNLFVLSEEDDGVLIQYEYLFTNDEIYARTISKQLSDETVVAGEFYDISLTNDTFLGYTQQKISSHNTDEQAHQDIRTLIDNLSELITQNTTNISNNTNSINNLQSSMSSLTIQVNNNSSLIAATQANLANNYYTKTQTYTKAEVNSLLGTAAGFQFVIVDELPVQGDPTKIYLVPVPQPEPLELADDEESAEVDDYYDEYIWLMDESRYECISSTRIDISDYVTKEEFNAAIEEKADASTVNTQLALKAEKTELPRMIILDEEV